MKKLVDLKILFTVVAILEFSYFLCAMIPPTWVGPVTGWNLNADGQWITKLVGLALGFMAYTAWIFRKNPEIRLAQGLAAYQILSATIDWVMWIVMKDENIFNNALAKNTVIAAIISHYALGVLMLIAIKRYQVTA